MSLSTRLEAAEMSESAHTSSSPVIHALNFGPCEWCWGSVDDLSFTRFDWFTEVFFVHLTISKFLCTIYF